MKDQQPTSAKAAFMHQGQARQPAPKPASAKAAIMHQGQDRQPTPKPTGPMAAFLHKGLEWRPVRQPTSAKAAILQAGQSTVAAKQGFDWSGLTAKQAADLHRIFDTIRKNDLYFDMVYRTLESQHGAYKFAVDPSLFVYKPGGTISYGQFLADVHREHGGIIAFPTTQGATNLGTTNEEFFHAYQNYFYGRKRMSRIGGSNVEFEPRFMAGYKMVNSEAGFFQMPGQERMFNLIMRMDEGATRLTAAQSQEYMASVEEFRQRWIISNRQANTTNLYDDPKTNDGPSAAFDIINKVRHGKK